MVDIATAKCWPILRTLMMICCKHPATAPRMDIRLKPKRIPKAESRHHHGLEPCQAAVALAGGQSLCSERTCAVDAWKEGWLHHHNLRVSAAGRRFLVGGILAVALVRSYRVTTGRRPTGDSWRLVLPDGFEATLVRTHSWTPVYCWVRPRGNAWYLEIKTELDRYAGDLPQILDLDFQAWSVGSHRVRAEQLGAIGVWTGTSKARNPRFFRSGTDERGSPAKKAVQGRFRTSTASVMLAGPETSWNQRAIKVGVPHENFGNPRIVRLLAGRTVRARRRPH